MLANSCQIFSYSWSTPPTVAADSVFTMDVSAVTDYGFGLAWAVFEVPVGFEVLGAGFFTQPSAPNIANASVTSTASALAPYVASPGHRLFGVSGQVLVTKSSINVDAKVYVRAPAVPGTYTIRMALAVGSAGALQPQLGLGSFQSPSGAAVRTVQVQALPAAKPFALASDGLWGLPRPLGAVGADVDRDGRPELLLANANGSIDVLRAAPGGFAAATTIPIPATSAGQVRFAVTDLDGDGWVDVVSDDGRVQFGVDGSQWAAGPQLLPLLGDAEVAAGDFDGDGRIDVALAGSNTPVCAVYRGLGNRSFAAPVNLPMPSGTTAWLLVEDLDLDGRSELVLGTRFFPAASSFWSCSSAGSWTLVGTLPAARGAIAIDRVTQPGKELVLGGVSIRYRWNGQVLTAATGQQLVFERAAVADFDRDGLADLLLANNLYPQGSTLQLLRRTSASQFLPVALPANTGFRVIGSIGAVLAGDFDGDMWPDAFASMDAPLAWHNTNTGAASYGTGCGGGTQGTPQLQALGTIGVGQSIDLQVASGQPSAITLFWAGDSYLTWFGLPAIPLSLASYGAPGCFLLAEPIRIVAQVADGAGVATLPVALPPLPSTWRTTVYAQAAVLDLAANPLGGRFSAALALKLQ